MCAYVNSTTVTSGVAFDEIVRNGESPTSEWEIEIWNTTWVTTDIPNNVILGYNEITAISTNASWVRPGEGVFDYVVSDVGGDIGSDALNISNANRDELSFWLHFRDVQMNQKYQLYFF